MLTQEELKVYNALKNIFNADLNDIEASPTGNSSVNLYNVFYDGFAVFRVFWDSYAYIVHSLLLEPNTMYSIQKITFVIEGEDPAIIEKTIRDLWDNNTKKVIDKFEEICNHTHVYSVYSGQLSPVYFRSRNFKTNALDQINPNLDHNPADHTYMTLHVCPAWAVWSRSLFATVIGSYDDLLDLLDRLDEADKTFDTEISYLESLGFTLDQHEVFLSQNIAGVNVEIYPCGGMSDQKDYRLFINQIPYDFGTLDELINFIVSGGD